MEKKHELTRYEVQSVQRIKQLIQEYCEVSQQRFAEKTGVNKGSVSQYLNGKNSPSNSTAKKIADTFHVAPAWVMGFDVARNSVITLNDEAKTDESVLLNNFRELTPEGRQKAIQYVIDLNQNMNYSAKLQAMQAKFLDGKEIEEYDDAISYLEQADTGVAACFREKLSENDIITVANVMKKYQRK